MFTDYAPALLCFACVCIVVMLLLYYLLNIDTNITDTDTDIVTGIWHGLPNQTSVTDSWYWITLDM